MSDAEGNAWRENAGNRVVDHSRQLKVEPPEAGWDKPKVGKFRSAMSWLGNKLSFGMLGGKDHRSRQETLKKREALVKSAFEQKMVMFDENEFDRGNKGAYYHQIIKDHFGDAYMGRKPRLRPSGDAYADLKGDTLGNPRYYTAPKWIEDSKFGRSEWDRLVSDSAGLGEFRPHVLDHWRAKES
jgi:hypothetical protein